MAYPYRNADTRALLDRYMTPYGGYVENFRHSREEGEGETKLFFEDWLIYRLEVLREAMPLRETREGIELL